MKMDFEQNGRLVTGGYITHPHDESTYTGVVSMEIVHIILTISELNNLDVCASEI